MIISARVVKNPQWVRSCSHCEKDILGPQLKLYGYAHYGEKPYNIYQHLDCGFDTAEKVRLALNEFRGNK